MRLLINTATTLQGGGIQVACSFLDECRRTSEHEYHVVLGLKIAQLVNQAEFGENFTFYEIPYRPARRVFSLRRPDAFLKEVERSANPDCVFTTSGPAYWRPRSPHLMGYTLPHYVYPNSQFFDRLTLANRAKWSLKGRLIKHYVRRDADAYVVQTDDVNQRLRRLFNVDDVHTVTNTYGSHFDDPLVPSEALLPERRPNEVRFLTLSAYYEHKNLEILNELIPILESRGLVDTRFVVTLPEHVFDDIFSHEAKMQLINVGPVVPSACPMLYEATDFVFLPTLLECFSANYVEGMRMQRPILTSDLGFAHTVCGDAALYFDPVAPADIADKIQRILKDDSLQQRLREAGTKRLNMFSSAAQRAECYLKICSSMVRASP